MASPSRLWEGCVGLQVQQRPDMQQSGQKEALHPSYREAPLLTVLYLKTGSRSRQWTATQGTSGPLQGPSVMCSRSGPQVKSTFCSPT